MSFEDQEVGSQMSLSALKPLSITTLSDDLGVNPIIKKPTSVSFYDLKQNEVLRDLMFVSPPKDFPIVSNGYFLRSCLKYFNGGFGPVKDTFQKYLPIRGRIGAVLNDYHSVMNGARVLRANSPLKFPL